MPWGANQSQRASWLAPPLWEKWLATTGYDPGFGARPLRRLIMKEIGDRLTEEILFGSLSRGGEVKIGFRQGELNFRFPEEAVAAP